MNYVIESNIPIPQKARKDSGLVKTALSMNVGQSIHVAGAVLSSKRSYFSKIGSQHGKKFYCDSTPEGVRIWRTQ